jgi:RNA-binding protein YlmH
MDKKQLLNEYKKQDDKILLAQILDKIEFSKQREKLEYTDFLDMYQIALVKNFLRKIEFTNYIFFGGFENSERNILIIYPEKYNQNMIEKNYNKILKVIRINLNEEEKGKYSHRNYLGGIVKLGIKREKVGDILVSDDGADIIVKEETSETLKTELSTLTRFENAELKIIEYQELREQEIKLEEINIIVPSLRLDNFVSDLAKTSRSKAVQIIDSERVFINGQNELKASKQVKLGDVITIRGKGRFVVKEFSGSTRSGRTVVKIEKYV